VPEPVLDYSEEYVQKKEYHFPEYVDSPLEKIEYLVEMAQDKIMTHDYQDLNVLYRRIYSLYADSEELSPNERYLIGQKINELFSRIKRIYLIEETF
jgi:hypothetical protein